MMGLLKLNLDILIDFDIEMLMIEMYYLMMNIFDVIEIHFEILNHINDYIYYNLNPFFFFEKKIFKLKKKLFFILNEKYLKIDNKKNLFLF